MGKGGAGGSRSQGDPDSAAQSGLSLGQLPGSKRSLNVLGLSSPRPGVGTRAERPPPPSPSGVEWAGRQSEGLPPSSSPGLPTVCGGVCHSGVTCRGSHAWVPGGSVRWSRILIGRSEWEWPWAQVPTTRLGLNGEGFYGEGQAAIPGRRAGGWIETLSPARLAPPSRPRPSAPDSLINRSRLDF